MIVVAFLLALDAWALARANDAVVWWVRVCCLPSRVLLHLTIGAGVVAQVLYVILDGTPAGFANGLVSSCLMLVVVYRARVALRFATPDPFHGGLALLYGFMLALLVGQMAGQLARGESIASGIAFFAGVSLYVCALYLIRVPPLDPPPGRERRVFVGSGA